MRDLRFNLHGLVKRFMAISFCIAFFIFATKGNAQTAGTGSIQGAVTDATGAVITSATVTATNTATQVKHTFVTSTDGLYSFPNISIGRYSVEVVAPGFKRYVQSSIVLDVGSSIAVNAMMAVGGSQQSIEVQSNGVALQTEDSSLKQTVDEHTITEMPLNGRQVSSLITITGGAVDANVNGDVQGNKTFATSVVMSIAGGQGNATDYRLDGGDHNDYQTNINLPFPFPDAIAQFSVETTALGAQSGLHPGGLVNVVTRSGSNQWHGSAFEFIRNNFINATNFFSTKKDTLHQNQYGGTFGGRIIRDKLFFFAGYQRLSNAQAQQSTTAHVPTAANLAGDFSATEGANCQTAVKSPQLLNPLTGDVLTNNQISPSFFNPTSLALEKYLPTTTDPCGLVSYAIPSQIGENQFVTRIDSTINAKNSIYGRYFLDGYTIPAFYSPTNILITTQSGNYERAQALTIGETYIISPSIVNSFHATATRIRNNRGPSENGINAQTIGSDVYQLYPVALTVSASNNWSTGASHAFFNVNTFSFTDDINWIHGKHQLAFGGEYARSEFNSSNVYDGNGAFTFSGIYSQTGPAGASSSGNIQNSNLDFLTGALNNIAQSKAQQNALRAPIPSMYFQDTYHATKKLVLNAGLRWDPAYFPTDYFGRGSVFDYGAFLANTHSTVFPLAPAGTFFYGDKGVPKAFTQKSPWQFSPRVGATYDPSGNGKLVVRVGASLVYDTTNFFTAERQQDNPPYGLTLVNTATSAPLNFTTPYSSGTVSPNPFPLPFIPTADTVFPLSAQYIILPAKFHTPYVMQYTASIQREFGHGWEFQIDYLGNKSTHLISVLPLSQAVYVPGVWGPNGTGCAGVVNTGPNAVKPGAAGTACSTTGNQASRFVLTRANPAQGPYYGGGNSNASEIFGSAQTGTYNGMVVSINHRVSSNFVLIANYTWSHCIDLEDNGGDSGISEQNPQNLRAERGSCGFDRRHIINTTVVATSHFGITGWKGQLINHWEISPLMRIMSGAPFTVTSGVDNSLIAINNDRPNLTNPKVLYTHNKIVSNLKTNVPYISAAAFTQNAIGTFGDSGRNAYRGPKFFQLDAAVNRSFAVEKSLVLNVRLDAFNVLNHPDFATPGSSGYLGSTTSLTSTSTFGQIKSTVYNYGARVFQGAIKFTF